jgi:hypothetical protein
MAYDDPPEVGRIVAKVPTCYRPHRHSGQERRRLSPWPRIGLDQGEMKHMPAVVTFEDQAASRAAEGYIVDCDVGSTCGTIYLDIRGFGHVRPTSICLAGRAPDRSMIQYIVHAGGNGNNR